MTRCGKHFRRLAASILASATLAGSVAVAATAAQQKSSTQTANKTEQKAQAKTPWSLKVSKVTPQTFSLRANNAKLSEIAAEIGRQLQVPVHLSPVMEKMRVTQEVDGLPLDAMLRTLAPQSYIDYELSGSSAHPKALALYLYALNEQPPSTNMVVKNTNEAVLIEGDTEEGTEAYEKEQAKEENPLRIVFTQNQLSVRARKQPLSVVLYKIASEVGIPFDLRQESSELVDVEFSNYSLEQAFRALSPSVRFYFRADLQTFEIKPLRLSLVPPART